MSDDVANMRTEKFIKVRPLLDAVRAPQVTSSFDRIAELLNGASFSGTARFTLIGASQKQSFIVALQKGSAKVDSKTKEVNLEVITTPETWLLIAQGDLAPLDAFTHGKLRVRGDYTLGQRIIKRLAASDGRSNFC